mmetsp:Transcript_21092/g.43109  ORF Transcript_21092/g.43109 Transcript_21092/m.43109 type:complete len:976 (+) Transcript_21092:1901-4828(+)
MAQDRVTIIVPNEALLLNGRGNGRDKMAKIRRDRQSTVVEPEYMGALRRTRLQLGENEQIMEVKLRVDVPLALHAAESKEALYRRLPWLSRPEDDDAYHAACRRSVKLLTTQACGERWYCPNQPCHGVNEPTQSTCHLCGAARRSSNLRPFFSRLSSLAHAVKKERGIKLDRLSRLDSELNALNEAMALTQDRLEELHRYKRENGMDSDNTFALPESLVMLDIDITLTGAWQRVDVRTLVPTIVGRQQRANKLLSEIRGELCIIVQALYETAAPTVQKLVRGHLLRRKFDSIRHGIIDEAIFAAAVKLQCTFRAYLAGMETEGRRQFRRVITATTIQCLTRQVLARREYKRRHRAYLDQIRREMAMRIQRVVRLRKATVVRKAMAIERERHVAEAEKVRITAAKDSSCVVIQSVARMYLAKLKVTQRMIELTLSNRLSLHLNRLRKEDGAFLSSDLLSFLKEINADYNRYDAEIAQIVQREDTMASTFVKKVVQLREAEYREAWQEYNDLKEDRADDAGSLSGEAQHQRNCHKQFGMYKPDRIDIEREGQTRCRPVENNNIHRETGEVERIEEVKLAGLAFTTSLEFPGDTLLRDVPDMLDDTLFRLIRAVTIRCFVPSYMTGETTGQEAYQTFMALPRGREKARHESESGDVAAPIISQLNQMGFVYIRDAMPRTNIISLLESLALPKPDGFVLCCNDILTILEKADQVNHTTRNALKSIVAEYLDARPDGRPTPPPYTDREDSDSTTSSECGSIAESLPGGLWDVDQVEKDVICLDSGAEPSGLCLLQSQGYGSSLTEDASKLRDSAPIDGASLARAKHEFERELDNIVSGALLDVSTGPRGGHDNTNVVSATTHRPSRTSTGMQSNVKQVASGFEGGLFRRMPKQVDTRRPTARNGGSNRCWAVQYSSHVMNSNPRYQAYRDGKRLLGGNSPAKGDSCSATQASSVLDGLPEDMQQTLQDMFSTKCKQGAPT